MYYYSGRIHQFTIDIVLLYNFELTPKGQTLRKTRRELKTIFEELREGEWSTVCTETIYDFGVNVTLCM